ncbi:LOW QUALITY PROTEIN: uncharacterized protein LOC114915573 [Cajanus cajan]|uniref:LOW QUALITY PROTEIN: uncharacterized protein LOC114915573 n=1 Tax=Cajanus cajan TaxID=3821 RepID=UPI0010FAE016|nr:LOW QUALITY PROTEIN: uncharacterized protein LOC114915573 [Cajanus cajan]
MKEGQKNYRTTPTRAKGDRRDLREVKVAGLPVGREYPKGCPARKRIALTDFRKGTWPNPERPYGSGSKKRDACARVRKKKPYFSLVERRHSVLAGVLSRIRSFFLGLLPCDTWQKRTQGHMPDLA